MPRVTVIIATYNWSTVLPYSIGSVLRQTFRDFELLVVGDGCTDDSEQVVGGIGDPRIRWINLLRNSGHQSAPNNEGLRQAQGEIVAYLGHDDLWLPHHLETLLRALDEERAQIACGLVANVGPEGSFVWPVIPLPERGAFVPPSGRLHHRRVTEELGGWRDYRELGDEPPDVEIMRRAQKAGVRIALVPRLTAIKFPASWRRNVYRERPHHEQAAWLARIDAEPDLEPRELAKMITGKRLSGTLAYSELVRNFVRETVSRVRRRIALPHWRAKTIDQLRRYKGLGERR